MGAGGDPGPERPAAELRAHAAHADHASVRKCTASHAGIAGKRPGFAGYIHDCSSSVAYAVEGHRLRREDLLPPRPNTWAEECIAVATMLLFFGCALYLPPLLLGCLVGGLVSGSKLCTAAVALTLAAYLLPPGKRWEAFVHLRVWDCWRRYFRYRGVVPVPPFLEPGRHCVFVHMPHAVFPMGSWLSFPVCGVPITGVPAQMEGLVATVLLKLPYFKHVFAWMGCLPADKRVFLECLRRSSVGLIVEGVAGIFHGATIDAERVYLKQRKGFVKIAMQAGVDICPVYHLGSSQMLRCSGHARWSRYLKATVAVFWGQYGLPLPYKHDIISLVGKPIPVTQEDHPTQEGIDELHARFVAATLDLFNEHKHLMPGWETKTLMIV